LKLTVERKKKGNKIIAIHEKDFRTVARHNGL
jgi:hypothetical protein